MPLFSGLAGLDGVNVVFVICHLFEGPYNSQYWAAVKVDLWLILTQPPQLLNST